MSTRMIAVKELVPGMAIGEPVLSANGKVLLGKDVVITPRTISLLTMWNVSHVFVNSENDTLPDTVTPEEAEETEETASAENGLTDEFTDFFKEYDSLVTTAVQTFNFIRNTNQIPVQKLKETSFSIYSTVLSTGPAIMDYLLVSDYNLADKVTRHSVMVAFISSIIGRKLKLSDEKINILCLAGLLHDIGKLVIPKEADAEARNHVIHGAKLLQHVSVLPQEVLLTVLQHHERMDGSGFPLGTASDKIHPFARIIAVADLFHQQAYAGEEANPFPVLEYMSKDLVDKLDQSVCQPFIRYVRDCLVNSPVLLSDGQSGQVIFFNSNRLDKPIVKTHSGTIIDLATTKNIVIERLINQEYLANVN
ncbi:HD-GYP domain-containing protein [Sporomusa acidovorans]|uniref:Cyclic-guanylate-specific phosphodiesterase n=1 Tax=Sporomusa acidovorans (strain ATCC 49682 / DSM 3132 / Mol) TaxID=1123286 RepID=A0ABZ3IVI8_SPOA4|nr:HD domain-containing phosphohydrolase [Sporomusa acidovorans]OZC15273.1 cyclic di-GMP phosphodiesterase response regulator RpfG [Sporomusa acidovorans DSM 3132]SDE91814.1 HDIG domain-containing protein [Sporomusa acidovorans]